MQRMSLKGEKMVYRKYVVSYNKKSRREMEHHNANEKSQNLWYHHRN